MDAEIRLLAHNIRSLWNVGSMFRTADAFSVNKLYLTGYTACPPRREISKTALGAEQWINWEHNENPMEIITFLKRKSWHIVGLEITSGAVPISKCKLKGKLCLAVGNEILGVSQEILDACDATVCIPMRGQKESLNVAVAAGIALYHFRELI